MMKSIFLSTHVLVAVVLIYSESAIAIPAPTTLLYQFERAGKGDVLAVLELYWLPATEAEVVKLTFTPQGQTLFGYEATYEGFFSTSFGEFIDDGIGGLMGNENDTANAVITDHSPPFSSLHTFGTSRVSLFATDTAAQDEIIVDYFDPSDPYLFAKGDWRSIPEPTTLILFMLANATLFLRRRVIDP